MNILTKVAQSAIFLTFFATAVIFGGFLFITQEAQAQYGSACSEYGVMAYEDYSGYCKCMSGYVFQDSYLGKQCVSADSVCHDDYGVMSKYDSLSNSCECSYGYVFGKDSIGTTQCITDDRACQNQLGYHSSAPYGGQCECDSGYVIEGGQCVDGDQVCRSDHGIYSSYNDYTNKCECDDNYTFDDFNQCVEKQHNVYFKLLDINQENDKELLIKSDYDSRKYIVRVGVGCLSTSMSRYEGKDLVVNLGTDYDVDMFDILVLQDHDQTCSIMHRERTYDDFFPEPKEDDTYYHVSPAQTYTPPSSPEPESVSEPETEEAVSTITEEVDTEEPVVTNTENEEGAIEASSNKNIEIQRPEPSESFFKKVINFFKGWF